MYILTPDLYFPHPETTHSSGVIAIGGDLSLPRLELAYQYGIFPWYSADDPILWWHPDPRFVLFPNDVYISKSMRSTINQNKFTVTFDTDFRQVITCCQTAKRKEGEGTWITTDIIEAYTALHTSGIGHSIEVWHEDNLVGGLYGVSLGKIFFGESMFSTMSNASKVALITLAKVLAANGYWMIDCQIPNPHLKKMGGTHISRKEFMKYIRKNTLEPTNRGPWSYMVEGKSLNELVTW